MNKDHPQSSRHAMRFLQSGISAMLILGLVSCGSGSRRFYKPHTFSYIGTAEDTPDTDLFLTDQKALLFSSNVVDAFRFRAGVSRKTRDISNSTQVTLAALAGSSGVLNLSKSAIAGFGWGAALIPDFQSIFNAKGRAEAYTDAVRLIETAQNEYLAYNQLPSNVYLTQNGVTLIQRTQASIHVVENVLAGRIPSPVEMKQATEPMSTKGASPTRAGSSAFNHVTAEGEKALVKGTFPGATSPGTYNPNDIQTITTATPPDVQADQMTVTNWITSKARAKEYAHLRQFLRDVGGDPTVMTDKQVATAARLAVRDAGSRAKVDVLLMLIDTPLDSARVEENKQVIPTSGTGTTGKKPAFPTKTQPQ